MTKATAIKVELPLVSLKSVIPLVLRNTEEKEQLVEDLTKMRYEGLLAEPWTLRSEVMVQEILQKCSNEWERTIQQLPEQWTVDSWVEVYSFRNEGRKLALRIGKWVEGKFDISINAKDGYAISECVKPRERRVLEFVIPILYPKKPNKITKIVGYTICGALAREYKANWGQIIQEVVEHLVSNLEKGKATPISPYLFHLYNKNECLRDGEMEELVVARKFLEFGISSEIVAHPDVVEMESERESLSSEEQRKILGISPSFWKKSTYCSPKGKSPVRNPD